MSKQRLISEINKYIKQNNKNLLQEISPEVYDEITKENDLYKHFLLLIKKHLKNPKIEYSYECDNCYMEFVYNKKPTESCPNCGYANMTLTDATIKQ